ncbi:MAG: 6-carboxytetrahydropterin synthase QueD [Polyangia bacterium]|jgi:6-pyruvoyltetrahydropterin/6-carboxytetrahydropterin synthase|nr:6-carboxytetrahydropterin synthase QueD [Polyangia bacterium]
MYEVAIRTRFAAAHRLANYGGKCEALHGHTWVVEVGVEGPEIDEVGLLMDFVALKRLVKDVVEELDHTLLNDHVCFSEQNPSSERVAKFFYDRLKDVLPSPALRVSFVRVWESEDSAATYRP